MLPCLQRPRTEDVNQSTGPSRLGSVFAVKVVLISPYEIGRQPFGLAQPAAWLQRAGFEVRCVDLAVQKLEPDTLDGASLVGIYLAMHTATRIAIEALPRIKRLAPGAVLAAYGLYAPMNHEQLRTLGVSHVFGGESEPDLLALAEAVAGHTVQPQEQVRLCFDRLDFLVPERSVLPALNQYASVIMPDGTERRCGFTETTRGCKHLCRHCPVVPVYDGRFKAIPAEVVLADITNQVESGAEHISFGDPDFLNGPTHALRVVSQLHQRFPQLSFDATIKVEHLLKHAGCLPQLAESGCLFVVSAVESVDDAVLERLDKGHSGADFELAARQLRDTGIAMSPTFVPFTPWTTLEGYVALLERLVALELVESVAPVQLAIRLLVPAGSRLLELDDFRASVGAFDATMLGHPWCHPQPAVDQLQQRIQALVEQAELSATPRRTTFQKIWNISHAALGRDAPDLPLNLGAAIPRHSEPWYCCAEPTTQQLEGY